MRRIESGERAASGTDPEVCVGAAEMGAVLSASDAAALAQTPFNGVLLPLPAPHGSRTYGCAVPSDPQRGSRGQLH